MTTTNTPQVEITDHGSVVTFTPLTQEAKDWFAENVASEGWQWLGPALGVDHRFATDLTSGLEDAGLI